MTRPTLHRQSGSWTFDDESECLEDMGLYASLAAVTLPDPKGGAIPAGRSAALTGRACFTSRAKPAAAIAIDALMWAVFVGCFALLASGAL